MITTNSPLCVSLRRRKAGGGGSEPPDQTNLQLFWKLGEAAGASRADSIGSNTLSDNNTVAQVTGKIGNAAGFSATSSQYLSIADNTDVRINGHEAATIFGWFRLTTLPSDDGINKWIVAKWRAGSGSGHRNYAIGVQSSNDKAIFQVRNAADSSTVSVEASTFGALSTGTWYYFRIWHDPVADEIGIEINADGNKETTAFSDGVTASAQDFYLGRLTTLYWNGDIDAVGKYDEVISDANNALIYNSGSGWEP